MAKSLPFTAIIEREGDGYVALCPELDVASQGDSVEEARANLTEAEAYLPLAGRDLRMPPAEDERPRRELLAWHAETVFRG